MVNDTDFKFDSYFHKESVDMITYFFWKKRAFSGLRDPENLWR